VDAFCLVTIDSNFCVRFFVADFVLERDNIRGSLSFDSVFFSCFEHVFLFSPVYLLELFLRM
jgi:hypothetical protein